MYWLLVALWWSWMGMGGAHISYLITLRPSAESRAPEAAFFLMKVHVSPRGHAYLWPEPGQPNQFLFEFAMTVSHVAGITAYSEYGTAQWQRIDWGQARASSRQPNLRLLDLEFTLKNGVSRHPDFYSEPPTPGAPSPPPNRGRRWIA